MPLPHPAPATRVLSPANAAPSSAVHAPMHPASNPSVPSLIIAPLPNGSGEARRHREHCEHSRAVRLCGRGEEVGDVVSMLSMLNALAGV